MINFIPLKQSEDMLTLQVGINLKSNNISKDGNFKELFEKISKVSDGDQSKNVKVDKNSNNFNSYKTNKLSKDDNMKDLSNASNNELAKVDIINKVNDILNDAGVSEEAMENLIAVIMNLINKLKNNNELNGDEIKQLDKLVTEIKEKFSNAMSMLNSQDLKDKIGKTISEVVDKIDRNKEVSLDSKDLSLDYKKLMEKLINNKNNDEKNNRVDLKEMITKFSEDSKKIETDFKSDLDTKKDNLFERKFDFTDIKSTNMTVEVNRDNVNSVKHMEIKELKDIIKIVDFIETAKNSGVKKLTIQLTPEHLGKLEIQLTETAGKITAKIFTDNEHARVMLLSSSDQIRNQLESKGIVIENMEFGFMMADDGRGDKSNKGEKGNFRLGGTLVDGDNDKKVENNGLYA